MAEKEEQTEQMTPEELQAAMEAADTRTTINLYKANGTFKQSIKLPPENATKYITMPDGIKYTRIPDEGELKNVWQAEA